MSWPEVSWYGQAIGAKRARRTPDESREDTHGARSFRPAGGGSSPDGSVAAYFGKGLMVWAEGGSFPGKDSEQAAESLNILLWKRFRQLPTKPGRPPAGKDP